MSDHDAAALLRGESGDAAGPRPPLSHLGQGEGFRAEFRHAEKVIRSMSMIRSAEARISRRAPARRQCMPESGKGGSAFRHAPEASIFGHSHPSPAFALRATARQALALPVEGRGPVLKIIPLAFKMWQPGRGMVVSACSK